MPESKSFCSFFCVPFTEDHHSPLQRLIVSERSFSATSPFCLSPSLLSDLRSHNSISILLIVTFKASSVSFKSAATSYREKCPRRGAADGNEQIDFAAYRMINQTQGLTTQKHTINQKRLYTLLASKTDILVSLEPPTAGSCSARLIVSTLYIFIPVCGRNFRTYVVALLLGIAKKCVNICWSTAWTPLWRFSFILLYYKSVKMPMV